MARATVLIPAHNEATLIGRTLLHLSRGLQDCDFRIVVIANDCSDATAAKARSVLPDAVVLETDTPGKCNALNLGFAHADKDKPIVCVDADLDVTSEALIALITPLELGTAQAACGQMDVCAAGASSIVRSYYLGWRTNPYFDRGKFGGVFALSAAAAARAFPLPIITADDEYIRRSFEPREIACVSGCRFLARAPTTLASLIKVRRRSLRGAHEVEKLGLPRPERSNVLNVMLRAVRRPSNALPILVYAAVNAFIRVSLKTETTPPILKWERDLTTRVKG